MVFECTRYLNQKDLLKIKDFQRIQNNQLNELDNGWVEKNRIETDFMTMIQKLLQFGFLSVEYISDFVFSLIENGSKNAMLSNFCKYLNLLVNCFFI